MGNWGRVNIGSGSAKMFAVIGVTYPSGSTCTCTNGTKTLKAKDTSGTAIFNVPSTGTWTVTATNGDKTASKSVSITAEGQTVAIELKYEAVLVDNGTVVVTPTQDKPSSGSGTYTYDMTDGGAKITSTKGGTNKYCMYWAVDASNYTTLSFTVEYSFGVYIYGTWDISTILDGDYLYTGDSKKDPILKNAIYVKAGATTAAGTKTFTYDVSAYTGTVYLRFGFYSGGGGASAWTKITDARFTP